MTEKENQWMQIGARLSNCRQNKNMTQEELARRLGITPQAVSKWERGQSFPDISMLADMAQLLEVSTDWLLGGGAPKEMQAGMGEVPEMQADLGKNLRMALEPLEMCFGQEIVAAFMKDQSYAERTRELRENLALDGMWLPVVRFRDDITLDGKEFMILAWQNVIYDEKLESVDGDTMGHMFQMLEKVIREKYREILCPDITKVLVDHLRIKYPALIEGVVPERIPYSLLTQVTKNVLDKGGSMRYLPMIIEAVDLGLGRTPDTGAEELARQALEIILREDNFQTVMQKRK